MSKSIGFICAYCALAFGAGFLVRDLFTPHHVDQSSEVAESTDVPHQAPIQTTLPPQLPDTAEPPAVEPEVEKIATTEYISNYDGASSLDQVNMLHGLRIGTKTSDPDVSAQAQVLIDQLSREIAESK